MKTTIHYQPLLVKIIVLITCCMLAVSFHELKASELPNVQNSIPRVEVIFKQDIAKNELTIRVKSGRDVIMQLFIFTPDGILIKEVAVSALSTTMIPGLERGLYLYECFDDDLRMKSGSLTIQ